MDCLRCMGLCAPQENTENVKGPDYKFPKDTLAYAVEAVALAVFAVFVCFPLLSFPLSICAGVGLLGLSLASAAQAFIVYTENRGKAELAFAISIKDENPEESEKWLKKAAFKRCNTVARFVLAETTNKPHLKKIAVELIPINAKLNDQDKARLQKLQDSLKAETAE